MKKNIIELIQCALLGVSVGLFYAYWIVCR